MKLRRIETPRIAHYAYLLADGDEAALVDPRRDVEDYLGAARELGVQIKYVIETHRQEDFVMGSAYLARRTGAAVVNGVHECFGHGDVRLEDGDELAVGGLTLRALHTPGHTPESMSYAVYGADDDEQARCVFTGDALFFGTTGRTDLADANKAVDNAALLYDSVHDKLAGLGDSALVMPAHGPGSVCGSGMAERPFSTIGDEKTYNDVFTLGRQAFADKKGNARLPRPPYFRQMEQVNLHGGREPALRPGDVRLIGVGELAETLGDRPGGALGDALLYDVRGPEAFAGGHIEGSFSIWLGGLPVFGGWVGTADAPIYIVGERDDDVDAAVTHLARIGLDNVRGGLAGGFGKWRGSGRPIQRSGTITPAELAGRLHEFQVLDVREPDEFAAGHIPGARHAYVGHLADGLAELRLERDAPTAVACSIGHRSGLGVSILLRHGFGDVRNVLGGMTAWRNLDLPTQ